MTSWEDTGNDGEHSELDRGAVDVGMVASPVARTDRATHLLRRGTTWAHVGARELLRGSLGVGELNKPVEWLYWLGNDVGRYLRYGSDSRLFGIIAYCGLFGKGKTISAVERGWRQKQRLKGKLKVWSNCPVAYADGPVRGYNHMRDCWQDGQNHLFIFDEIHLTWESNDWKNIDPEVLQALTQQRKYGGGFAVYYTTQRLVQTATIWRRLAEYIVDCEGWPNSRWIHQKAYRGIEEYNDGMPRRNPLTGEDMRQPAWKYSFIAEDWLRNQYDTLWVARKMTGDGEVAIIGADAVRRKMELDAELVPSLLERRRQADQGRYVARERDRTRA